MRLYHHSPCKECPWRRESVAGWLGGHSPESYADPVVAGECPACHLKDHGPDDDKTAFCAGALACMANAAMTPYKQHGVTEARDTVGKRDDCFAHPAEFYEHHTDETYTHPLLRKGT